MQVPLLDLKAQYKAIKADVDAAVAEVIESQHFILGPKLDECENSIARYSECEHAIGMSSGSDALLACLMAENIGPGDEVITTSYTFCATAGAIARVGATPVFVDIDPVTCNLDAAQILSRVTNRTRAIIPVHLYGQMADMTSVMQAAEKYNLIVIEDAAQAIGAENGGRRAGSVGHYGCFSFFLSKNLGAAGDGGMVVTNDTQRADRLRCLRTHGSKPKYYQRINGGNFRLDALQAAVISAKLRHLDRWTAARQQNAKRYDELFSLAGLTSTRGEDMRLGLPRIIADHHIFNQYVIRVSKRDELQAYLQKKGVATEVYFPIPLHLQDSFAHLGYKPGDFPESERAAKETLALPVHPELTEPQAQYVVQCIREFLAENKPSMALIGSPISVTQKSISDNREHDAYRREIVLENSNGGHGNSAGVAPTEFKKALGKFASGVTVVTVEVGGITRGMTVSAFFSLSMDPPLVAVAVHKQSKLHSLLQEATKFGISILASHQANLSDHFAGRLREVVDIQFAEVGCVPVIQDALVHLCCAIAARYDGGDHTIYTGLVRDLKHREDCEALVYFSGNYRAFDSTTKRSWQQPAEGDTRTEAARLGETGQSQ